MVTNAPSNGLINSIIRYCALHPLVTLLSIAAATLWGYHALMNTPLDALPDLSDVQVIVYTEWPGQSPDLVEDQITYPLTSALLSVPNVQFVRGQSFFGSSFVYVIFAEHTDIYWARSRVSEFLNTVMKKLPSDVQPTLGPDATGVGWVYQYALVDKSGQYNLAELRSLQDFSLSLWLQAVPGVAEVASVGGFVKEYQVNVEPNKLAGYGISLAHVAKAIRRSNNSVGARVLEIAGHEHFIRGRGYIQSEADIKKIVLKVNDKGIPVTVADVALVELGPAMRRGLAELDGQGETVGGIVIMRYGEDALSVIEGVKQRIETIRAALPTGVEIITVYDRSDLIQRAINTLKVTLFEEIVVVSLVILLFFRHPRSVLIVVVTLPVAILLAFIPMQMQHLSANIMSLGGIAVAIGAMVDAAIVMLDNIHRHRNETDLPKREVIIQAMQEVGPSIFFSLLIITLSFLPVFSFSGIEGRLFSPLAYTKTYAMGFAAILAITLTPALAVILFRGSAKPAQDQHNPLLHRLYQPVLKFALTYRGWVLTLALLSVLITIPIYKQLGNEFMPPLNEGSLLYMPTALPGMSVTEAGKILQAMNKQLKQFPEVEHVFGKIGRSTSPTDSAPLSMVETVISLKPQAQWREGLSWKDLIAEMDKTLDYPGMPNIWWMPIQTRTEMLATGIRSNLGIKIFGNDLDTLEKTAVRIEQLLQQDKRTAPYTRSAFAERLSGGYYLDFDIDRDKIARYGLTIADVQEPLSAAVGGTELTQVLKGRERYALNLRYARAYRDNPEVLKRILIDTPNGAQIPISLVADIHFRTGPPMLRNEDGQLVAFVFVDVNNMGIADYVQQAQTVINEKAAIPVGYRMSWAGQFKYFQRAQQQLQWIFPLTLLSVFLLLFFNHGSVMESLLVLSTIPFALTGAIWLLYLLDYRLSVAVWVGLIALAGLAAEMGVLMMLYLSLSYRQFRESETLQTVQNLNAAICNAAVLRIRPMLMTSLTLLFGLTPVLISNGTGADVMQRIAAPMVGGVLSALILVLLVFPVLFSYWKGCKLA